MITSLALMSSACWFGAVEPAPEVVARCVDHPLDPARGLWWLDHPHEFVEVGGFLLSKLRPSWCVALEEAEGNYLYFRCVDLPSALTTPE